jgi:alpha-amylase
MPELNGVMMQYFHWYNPADGSLWKQVVTSAPKLAQAGITALWLPPAYKGIGGGSDVGYGVYDLFDLGEFDQKGSIRTKYGTKDEYIAAVAACRAVGIAVYGDAVFNHKMGADAIEEVEATPLDPNLLDRQIDGNKTIKAWTHFTFTGRQGKYSTMEWHWWHFDAVDYNADRTQSKAVYLLKDKQFDRNVDREKSNFDYLMGADLDMDSPEVIEELSHWGDWFVNTTGVDGFRFDAVKHVEAQFFVNWLNSVSASTKKSLFAVGEYWSDNIEALRYFIDSTQGKITLFDAPLHYNFCEAGKSGSTYDLRQIFDNTLVQQYPTLAVTLVENHDSQPLQALESVVESWFKPLAYALILLRQSGYPCIFYADYYGATYKDKGKDGREYEILLDSHQSIIDKLLFARKTYAFGREIDYLDYPTCIGWTRLGSDEHPCGMAVLISNGGDGQKWMEVGHPHTAYIDLTENIADSIVTNEHGWAEFRCRGGSVSVWIPRS